MTENHSVGGSIPPQGTIYAVVAQLVECHLAKVDVAGPSPVYRSIFLRCHSQVVRRRSAKPLFSSSNLDGTSRRNPAESTSAGFSIFFHFRKFWSCCLFCCLLVISPVFSSSPGRSHWSSHRSYAGMLFRISVYKYPKLCLLWSGPVCGKLLRWCSRIRSGGKRRYVADCIGEHLSDCILSGFFSTCLLRCSGTAGFQWCL